MDCTLDSAPLSAGTATRVRGYLLPRFRLYHRTSFYPEFPPCLSGHIRSFRNLDRLVSCLRHTCGLCEHVKARLSPWEIHPTSPRQSSHAGRSNAGFCDEDDVGLATEIRVGKATMDSLGLRASEKISPTMPKPSFVRARLTTIADYTRYCVTLLHGCDQAGLPLFDMKRRNWQPWPLAQGTDLRA